MALLNRHFLFFAEASAFLEDLRQDQQHNNGAPDGKIDIDICDIAFAKINRGGQHNDRTHANDFDRGDRNRNSRQARRVFRQEWIAFRQRRQDPAQLGADIGNARREHEQTDQRGNQASNARSA